MLTSTRIIEIAEGMPGGLDGFLKGWGWQQFARAIEEEVHKADADLIEQVTDAMERAIDWDKSRNFPIPYRVRDPINSAITAARARLGEKEPT